MEHTLATPALWFGFIVFVLLMLALDLGLFHRRDHVVGVREALIWSGVWVSLALLFSAGLFWRFGQEHGFEFLTGYLIEKSLSIDNIFVFIVIFSSLRIPAEYQHRVLYWGILSALVMRAAMIFAGVAMITRFHWLMYVFGGFLIVTGVRLFLERNQHQTADSSRISKWLARFVRSTDRFDGHAFFTREAGRWVATPLFMALVMIEFSDILFAVDSIPAIFAVTTDPFIVFTSNIFAILGLRSLFFVMARLVDRFRYLKIGLAAVLVFVGAKMMLVDVYKIHALVSLSVIISLLTIAIAASFLVTRREEQAVSG